MLYCQIWRSGVLCKRSDILRNQNSFYLTAIIFSRVAFLQAPTFRYIARFVLTAPRARGAFPHFQIRPMVSRCNLIFNAADKYALYRIFPFHPGLFVTRRHFQMIRLYSEVECSLQLPLLKCAKSVDPMQFLFSAFWCDRFDYEESWLVLSWFTPPSMKGYRSLKVLHRKQFALFNTYLVY